MIVVVDVPDLERGGAFGLGRPLAGVEQLLGQGPVVALDLAVVLGRVRADALVTGRRAQDRAVEVFRSIVRSVVRHDPGDARDAVGGEERPRASPEADRGRGGLVAKGFGVFP